MTAITTIWGRIGDWLMRKWLWVIVFALAFLLFTALITGKKSQEAKDTVEEAVQGKVLSDEQVAAQDKKIAALVDSADHQEAKNKIVVVQRDSLKAVADYHEAKADSAIKALNHEVLIDADATPSRVFDRLASYKPSKYALGDGDSIY